MDRQTHYRIALLRMNERPQAVNTLDSDPRLTEGLLFSMASVEEARRNLQERYNKEAKEAVERLREKEQKKREEWLARQEKLVRPGHVLGHGRKTSADSRDEEEHVRKKRQRMQEQYNEHVQHGRRLKKATKMEVEPEHCNIEQPAGSSDQSCAATGRSIFQNPAPVGPTGRSIFQNPAPVGGDADVQPSSAESPDPYDAQLDPREMMLAARARLQAQYDEQVHTLASAEGRDATN